VKICLASGRHDSEATYLAGDTPELQHVTGHDSGSDLSRCKSNQQIVHGTQPIRQTGGVSIHRSEDPSRLVKDSRSQSQDTTAVKRVVQPVDGSLSFRRVSSKAKFEENNGRYDKLKGSG
jgi:hypothetical protein